MAAASHRPRHKHPYGDAEGVGEPGHAYYGHRDAHRDWRHGFRGYADCVADCHGRLPDSIADTHYPLADGERYSHVATAQPDFHCHSVAGHCCNPDPIADAHRNVYGHGHEHAAAASPRGLRSAGGCTAL